MHRLPCWTRWQGALAALLLTSAAHAQAPFYSGKQLTILVNYSPGGPTDAEARLLGRHLSRLIPGSPGIIVKNMGGAGGAIGANWLGQLASADGLTLGYFTGTASKAALGDPALKVDLSTFTFLAAGPGISVTYARADIGGGIKVPTDLLRKKDFWAGGLTPDSDKDIRMRMQLDLLGIKHNYVSGFSGSAEARLAFQRGEIQHYVESMPTYRAVIEPGPVKIGEAIPVWIDPLDDGENFTRSPDAEGIPAAIFTELLRQHNKGELPKSEMFEAFRLVNQVGTQFLRLLLMPPGTPKEPAKAVRQALLKAATDAEFREDAMKSIKFVPKYVAGDQVERLFRDKLNPDPKLKAFIRAYIEKVGPDRPKKPGP